MKQRVMFVCTGNICRSPFAHGLLEHLLREHSLEHQMEVASSGTHAHVGEAPHPLAITVAAVDYGIDISGLRGRQFERADFARFDHLIALDRSHLARLHTLKPAASRVEPRLLLAGMTQGGDAEVPDPYGRDRSEFEYVGRLIMLGVQRLVNVLGAEVSGLSARGR